MTGPSATAPTRPPRCTPRPHPQPADAPWAPAWPGATALRWLAAVAVAMSLAACGALDGDAGFALGGNGGVTADTELPVTDAGPVPADAAATDTPSADAPADTVAHQDAGRDGGGKADGPAPPPGPTRLSLALHGDRAAWVEVAPDGSRSLAVWTLSQPDTPPTAYPWPYLVQPRALQLTDGWLVFVDEPYNDADVFALRLGDGAVLPVVTRPGAQDHPAVLAVADGGPAVAWQDCRECLAGAPPTPAIYLRALPDSAEVRLSGDGTLSARPVAGTLADGAPALTWLVDGSTARVWSPGPTLTATPAADLTVALPFAEAAGVALTRGVLASRPRPLIINPDSMMPSDVFLTELATGQTRRVSTHAELDAATPAAPVGWGGRVAWLESLPGAGPAAQRIVAVDVSAPSVPALTANVQGATSLALSESWVGVTAPPGGAGAPSDVWLREIP